MQSRSEVNDHVVLAELCKNKPRKLETTNVSQGKVIVVFVRLCVTDDTTYMYDNLLYDY